MWDEEAIHKCLLKAFGFKWPPNYDAPELKHNETFQKIERAAGGISGIVSIVDFLNTDAAYYEKPSSRATRTRCSFVGSSTTAAMRSSSAICVPKP
jgi:hypothetical protein